MVSPYWATRSGISEPPLVSKDTVQSVVKIMLEPDTFLNDKSEINYVRLIQEWQSQDNLVPFYKYKEASYTPTRYMKEENTFMATIQDITESEKRRAELDKLRLNTVDVAQKVIDKQMMVAQEIASLLGETTAETKVALNKLKKVVLKEGE